VKRIVATEDGLSLAKEIAEKLNIPFDREATRSSAKYLLEHYYEDIQQVLVVETEGFLFENLANKSVEAFSGYNNEGKPLIFIDQFFGPYFFGLNSLLCFIAFYPHDYDSLKNIAEIFSDSLATFSEPEKDEIVRERLRPLLHTYVDALPIANALTYSSITHIICHEIAHHNLGHLEEPQESSQEFSADILGYQYFLRLIEHQDLLQNLKIGENMVCAPIVTLELFAFMEESGQLTINESSHPSASIRARELKVMFDQCSNVEAQNLYRGIELSLEDLRNMLINLF